MAMTNVCASLELQAANRVLDLQINANFTQEVAHLITTKPTSAAPWLLCYNAFDSRIRGEYTAALAFGQTAITQFEHLGDLNGQARAVAETAIARYHLGQFTTALAELAACPLPVDPICVASLYFASYLNRLGVEPIENAISVAHQGLQIIEREPNEMRRIAWRILLQRNLVAAYYYQGNLATARHAAEEAVQLAATYHLSSYIYDWSVYELGLLEQRAGRLEIALATLRHLRDRVEPLPDRKALWRWIVVAEAHTLRDLGALDEAYEFYRLGGWGEGEDGPLMLWLLQGRITEARCAAEAYLTAAHASASITLTTSLVVFLALLDLEQEATDEIRRVLNNAAEQFATLGFHHGYASILFHLAFVEYKLSDHIAGNQTLTKALHFGATQGYLNFAWWHPLRMQWLLERAMHVGIETEYSERLLRERGLSCSYNRPKMLAITCLGRFEAQIDHYVIPPERWREHKAGALRMQRMLIYLARYRQPQSIQAIAQYVWPDKKDDIDIVTNVHVTLCALRRVLEPDLERSATSRFILTTADGYQLCPTLDVMIDLEQFYVQVRRAQRAEAFGEREAVRTIYTRIEQLYTGDFALAKADPDEAEEYRRAFLNALRRLATDDLQQGNLEACIARSKRLLREDRWDIDAPALLIQAYIANGNRRAARRQYEQFCTLHGQPTEEIVDLVRQHNL
jgi:DNA-binding SARP family transcriptional activator